MTSMNDSIVLFGGKVEPFPELALFFEGMPYLIVDTAEHGIQFYASDFSNVQHLTILRLHAFGSGGDLLIRRDEHRCFWRFVGNLSVFDALGRVRCLRTGINAIRCKERHEPRVLFRHRLPLLLCRELEFSFRKDFFRYLVDVGGAERLLECACRLPLALFRVFEHFLEEEDVIQILFCAHLVVVSQLGVDEYLELFATLLATGYYSILDV